MADYVVTSTASSSPVTRATTTRRSGSAERLGAKAWRDLEKNRLAVAKPVYAAQVAMYQAYLDLHANPALFTAINADTMEVYAERVPFDGQLAQRMSDRAVQIVLATDAGELLPRSFSDPTHFECHFCAWQDRCWRPA